MRSQPKLKETEMTDTQKLVVAGLAVVGTIHVVKISKTKLQTNKYYRRLTK